MSMINRFSDWRGFRKALALTQEEMASLVGLSFRGYQYMESHGARPARRQTIDHFRYALLDPTIQRLLAQSGYPHPFPDDVRQAQEVR